MSFVKLLPSLPAGELNDAITWELSLPCHNPRKPDDTRKLYISCNVLLRPSSPSMVSETNARLVEEINAADLAFICIQWQSVQIRCSPTPGSENSVWDD